MAITDYTSLKTAVQSYCGRSDSIFATALEQFVAFTEDRIYFGVGAKGDPLYSAPVRSPYQEVAVSVTMTSGAGTIPDYALEVRRVTHADDRVGMEYMPPDLFKRRAAQGGSGSDPAYYTVEGQTLSVFPTFTGPLELGMWRRYNALSPTTTTSVMLTAYPMLYLSATLAEAFAYMQEPDLASMHLGRYRAQVEGVNATAVSMRMPGKKRRLHSEVIG